MTNSKNKKTETANKRTIESAEKAKETRAAKDLSATPLLEYRNVTKSYGDKTVLKNINLKIPRGRIVGLLGKNGAGKTTLIKLANDLLQPTSGEILVDEQPISVNSKEQISYLPEVTYLDKTMRVCEAMSFFAEFYRDFNLKKAQELAKTLDLDLDKKIIKMSKGMQEKLQLILVISRKADLYILDEPLGGIDPATRDFILDTILSNFDENASLLISTHLIADIERILDEVIFINDGKVVLESEADILRQKEHASIDEIFRKRFRSYSISESTHSSK